MVNRSTLVVRVGGVVQLYQPTRDNSCLEVISRANVNLSPPTNKVTLDLSPISLLESPGARFGSSGANQSW